MADVPGKEVAAMLLRALPPDVAEVILGRLGPAAAKLRAAPGPPPNPADLAAALAQFFDLERIARRASPAGEYRPVAGPPPGPADPLDEVKAMPPDRLARALEGEQPATVALVLSRLDPAAAGQVMRRLPAQTRADVAVRLG